MNLLSRKVSEKLEARGCMVRITGIEHVRELGDEINNLHSNNLLDEGLYEESLKQFNFNYEEELLGAGSVIVVAIPHPITKLSFKYKKKPYSAVIPPTYITRELDRAVFEELKDILGEEGYKIAKPRKLPLKLLAVRSGLSKYGRNNITYVEGMGSFYKLQAYYTDYKCIEDSWKEEESMQSCSSCNLCVKKCPTGCIDTERFLIHAENCLTNLNEYAREFPGWVNNKWHNSLVGCMECQLICPQNRKHLRIEDVEEVFSEDEIDLLLNNKAFNELPEETANTLNQLSLEEYYKDNVLSRNLRVLIDKESQA